MNKACENENLLITMFTYIVGGYNIALAYHTGNVGLIIGRNDSVWIVSFQ